MPVYNNRNPLRGMPQLLLILQHTRELDTRLAGKYLQQGLLQIPISLNPLRTYSSRDVMIVCKVFGLYIGLLSCAVDGTSFLRPAQGEFSAWPERYFFVPAAQIPSFSNTLQRYEIFRCKTIVSPNYFS